MPYVLKPVLIVVLVLTPTLSETRILVTGIIVVLVQMLQIPTFCQIIYGNTFPSAVLLFIVGTTPPSNWLWFSFLVFFLIFFLYFAKIMNELSPFVTISFAQVVLMVATVNNSFRFVFPSALIPIWLLLGYSINVSESTVLTKPLILGLGMNVVFSKFGMIDIMVLMITVAIILDARTSPLLILAASKLLYIK